MSASREKKQRVSAEPVDKAVQAQQEQAAYKRKARTYTIIGVVICVLVAALLIWNSGLFQSRATAATIGDNELSVSELSYYYYDYYTRSLLSYYGAYDATRPDSEQMYDEEKGTTYYDYFLENALTKAQLALAKYDAAIEAGYTDSDIKDELDAEIDAAKAAVPSSGYGSYSALLKAMYGRYMTPSVYKKMVTRTLLGDLYYNDLSAENQAAFTAEQLEAYYTENADSLDEIEYSYLLFSVGTVEDTDADGNKLTDEEVDALTEEAMAAAKEKADAALAEYKNGTELADLIESSEPSSSTEHTVTQGVDNLSSLYSEELLKLGVNEATVVEVEDVGYYLVVFHGRERNETLTANVRHILFAAETTTDAEGNVVAPTDVAWAAAEEKAQAALAEYKAGELTAEAFGALAEKYSEDAGSNTNGGLYEDVAEGDFVTEFNDWMFGENQPAAGDTSVIRHEGDVEASNQYWGYHVTYLDSWGEAKWALDASDALLKDTMTEWSENLIASGYETAAADGAAYLGK